MTQPYAKPLPSPTPQSEPFWQAAKQHRLSMQQCDGCGGLLFYPRSLCPECWSEDLRWVELSGAGSVYTYTLAHHPTHPTFADEVPYVIAVVELAEGPRLTANLVGCAPDQVKIGMPVTAVYDDVTPAVTLVKFRPVV